MDEKQALLRNNPYFANLSTTTFERVVQVLKEDYYYTGDVIVSSSSTDTDFYIIEYGRVRKEVENSFGASTSVGVLRGTRFFGHFSLVHKTEKGEQIPHALTMRALDATYIYKIEKDDFLALYNEYNDFKAVIDGARTEDFADRIRELSFFSALTPKELNVAASYVGVKTFTAPKKEGKKQAEAKPNQPSTTQYGLIIRLVTALIMIPITVGKQMGTRIKTILDSLLSKTPLQTKVSEDIDNKLNDFVADEIELFVMSSGKFNIIRPQSPTLKRFSIARGGFISQLSAIKNTVIEVAQNATVFTLNKKGVEALTQTVAQRAEQKGTSGKIRNLDLEEVLTHNDIIKELKEIPLFNGFQEEDYKSLSWMMGRATIKPDNYICRQGDAGARYFILYEGEVELRALNKDGKKPPGGAKHLKIVPTPPEQKKDISQKIASIKTGQAINTIKTRVINFFIWLTAPIRWLVMAVPQLFKYLFYIPLKQSDEPVVEKKKLEKKASGPKEVRQYGYHERTLFLGDIYDQGIWTTGQTDLYFINHEDFETVREKNFGLEKLFNPNEKVVQQSFYYANVKIPNRLPGEKVLYYSKRHWMSFVVGLFKPPFATGINISRPKYIPSFETVLFIGLMITAVLVLFGSPIISSFSSILSSVADLIANITAVVTCFSFLIMWIIWVWADWRNDYLMITNERVIREEKVVLLYEDQAVSEIYNVENVTSRSKFLGNMLGYYDVQIDTAAPDGQIIFDRTPKNSAIHNFVASLPLINLLLKPQNIPTPDNILKSSITNKEGRKQAFSVEQQRRGLEKAIEAQMGKSQVDPWDTAGEAAAPKPKETAWQKRRKDIIKRRTAFLDTIIPWRYVDVKPNPKKNIMVWRRHWSALIKETWASSLMFLLFTGFLAGSAILTAYVPDFVDTVLQAVGFLVFLVYVPIVIWFWWSLADWGNDLYVLTKNEVKAIHKKPMLLADLTVQSDLDKIQNVYFKRVGLFNSLFNVGDVIIETAGNIAIEFKDIHQPREVQHQVYKRMNDTKKEAAQKKQATQQKDFTKWFDVYHHSHVNLGN